MIVEIVNILISGLIVGLASSVTVGPVAVLCIQRTLSKGYMSGIFSGLGVAVADTLMAILAFTVYALLKSYIDDYAAVIQLCGGVFVIIVGIFIFFKNPVPQIRKNRAGKSALWQDFVSMFGFTLANFIIVIPYILAFFTMLNIELSAGQDYDDNPKDAVEQVVETTEDDRVDMEEFMSRKGVYRTTTLEDEAWDDAKDDMAKSDATLADAKEESFAGIYGMMRNVLILLGFLVGAMSWWFALTSLINLFRRNFRPRHLVTLNRIAGIIISTLGIYAFVTVLITL